MKVAFLVTSFPHTEQDDPVFPATWEMVRGLKRQGHDVRVFTIGKVEQPESLQYVVAGIPVTSVRWNPDLTKTCFDGSIAYNILSMSLARASLLYTAFNERLQEFQPDVVECQDFNGLSMFLAAQRKFPIVLRCYGPMSMLMLEGESGSYGAADQELTEALELCSLILADGAIAVSHDLAGWLSRRCGRPLDNFNVVRIPLSVKAVPEVSRTVNVDCAPNIFYFGRVERHKGCDLLIESLPLIAAKYPNVRMRFGGQETTVTGDSEPYGNKMRRRLKELNMLDHADFLGFMSRERIMAEVRAADICIFPSKSETACYTLLEAITYGGIAMATRVGGLPEYHIHGESAWLVDPMSPQAIADGVIELAGNPNLRKRMLANARKHVEQFCDPDRIVGESVAVYQKAADNFAESAKVQNSTTAAMAYFAEKLLAALPDTTIQKRLLEATAGPLAEAYERGRQAGLAEAAGRQSLRSIVSAAKHAVSAKLIGFRDKSAAPRGIDLDG